MPCEHLCAFLGGCVSLSGCHPKYSRSAERGDIDDWLFGLIIGSLQLLVRLTMSKRAAS